MDNTRPSNADSIRSSFDGSTLDEIRRGAIGTLGHRRVFSDLPTGLPDPQRTCLGFMSRLPFVLFQGLMNGLSAIFNRIRGR